VAHTRYSNFDSASVRLTHRRKFGRLANCCWQVSLSLRSGTLDGTGLCGSVSTNEVCMFCLLYHYDNIGSKYFKPPSRMFTPHYRHFTPFYVVLRHFTPFSQILIKILYKYTRYFYSVFVYITQRPNTGRESTRYSGWVIIAGTVYSGIGEMKRLGHWWYTFTNVL
jgi:hypothetical protein